MKRVFTTLLSMHLEGIANLQKFDFRSSEHIYLFVF